MEPTWARLMGRGCADPAWVCLDCGAEEDAVWARVRREYAPPTEKFIHREGCPQIEEIPERKAG